MDFQKICNQTEELAKEVGAFIREEGAKFSFGTEVSKGKNDFVTRVDKEAEKRLISGLKQILPQSTFLAEEGTEEYAESDLVWIIDPIDGTTNFIHQAPPFSISLALQVKSILCVGVVYEIAADECFSAWKDGGAFLNKKGITVSSTSGVNSSLLATGFPYTEYGRMSKFMETLTYFFHNSHGVRRLGSAAVDLAYVACGRYDAFYEYNLKPWDVAAGAFIVQEAGGAVCDFKGGDKFLFGKEIIASNANAHAEFVKVIGDIMNE